MAGDLDAQYYKEHSHLQYNLAHELLDSFLIEGHENILDVGCGDGKITAQLAKQAAHGRVIGIDKSPSMIALASSTFPSNQYPNLTFQVQEATNIQSEITFDLITSFSCLHWVKDQRAAFQQIKKSLKPNRKALIFTYARCPTFWDPIEAVVDQEKWKSYFDKNSRPYSFLDKEAYRKMIGEIGLKIIQIKTTSLVGKFKGKMGFVEYVKGWLPFLIDLPPALHNQLLEEIGDKSLEYAPLTPEGLVEHPYDTISMLLEK